MTLSISCPDPETTLLLGETIGAQATPGLVVALQGPLGAGKTWLTKGIAKGLDVPDWRYLTSPTFALHNVYEGRLRLHHLDLYRIEGAGELEDLGLDDVLYGSEVCVIEWPDRFFQGLPKDMILLRFQQVGETSRVLEVDARGRRCRALEAALRAFAEPRSVEEQP